MITQIISGSKKIEAYQIKYLRPFYTKHRGNIYAGFYQEKLSGEIYYFLNETDAISLNETSLSKQFAKTTFIKGALASSFINLDITKIILM